MHAITADAVRSGAGGDGSVCSGPPHTKNVTRSGPRYIVTPCAANDRLRHCSLRCVTSAYIPVRYNIYSAGHIQLVTYGTLRFCTGEV